MEFKDIKIVVLDCPINHWEDPKVRSLFNEIIQFKLEGYWAEYPHDVIVTDTSDFIGTHLLACVEQDSVLKPIMGYKAVTVRRCEYFHQTFPALNCLKNLVGHDLDYARMLKVVNNCKNKGIDISYDSAWTASEEVRKNKELSKKIREITTTLAVFYHQNYSVPEWITGGVLKFKTDQYFKWMGLEEITEPIAFPTLAGGEARLMHLNSYSTESLQIAEQHRDLWENRMFIGGEEKVRKVA